MVLRTFVYTHRSVPYSASIREASSCSGWKLTQTDNWTMAESGILEHAVRDGLSSSNPSLQGSGGYVEEEAKGLEDTQETRCHRYNRTDAHSDADRHHAQGLHSFKPTESQCLQVTLARAPIPNQEAVSHSHPPAKKNQTLHLLDPVRVLREERDFRLVLLRFLQVLGSKGVMSTAIGFYLQGLGGNQLYFGGSLLDFFGNNLEKIFIPRTGVCISLYLSKGVLSLQLE